MSEPAVPLVLSRITIATTSRQEGKTNLSHDGLNPAHVPYSFVPVSTSHFLLVSSDLCYLCVAGIPVTDILSDGSSTSLKPASK